MIKKRKHRIHFIRATGTYNLLTQCFPLIALNPFTDLLRFSIPKIHSYSLLFQITGYVVIHRLCTGFSTKRAWHTLAAHIFILKRKTQRGIAAELDHGLQVVDFFTGNPYDIVHDLDLYF